MASRIVLALASAALALSTALPTWGASSINTTIPMNGVPYSPAPIRSNFSAAANDINALQSMNLGTSPPSNPSPGALWLDNGGVTTYDLKIWDGRGNAWLHIATLDTINNIWQPPVGGGIPPTILSASTTDLGSVPQAAVYIAGNSSIQSFGATSSPGIVKFLVFTGSATLVNTPNVLNLPNGADVTQAAGDTAIALQLSQGNWQILNDSRAAAGPTTPRTLLTNTGNLYVATTGSDASNNCASSLVPCQTIQHACNVATTQYDLAGQQLLINVTNGTYSAGCNIAGQLVGTATLSTNPALRFPITGLQIIGNPSNPSLAIIADTSSPGFAPAVFSASSGAYYSVSGFTISSVNGHGLLSQANALLEFSNMVFGNCGVAQMTAQAQGILFGGGSFTIAGSAPSSILESAGGFVEFGRGSTPMIITVTGIPSFPGAFANISGKSTLVSPSDVVTINGTATGPKFIVKETSLIDTNVGSPTYFPGDVNGAIKDYSLYSPMPEITTFTSQTGLGAGGTIVVSPVVDAFVTAGHFDITAGTGASSSGEITFLQPTHQLRICIPTLDNSDWAQGATIRAGQNLQEDSTTFEWDNNGVPLTNGLLYVVLYTCFGLHH